mmetsp:Transcript_12807/g.25988  ORF Transcript_12807/g.25988 Transcript_12807/m.25988 type:complete len:121 (-) Transcript_12807:1618-1980(-)
MEDKGNQDEEYSQGTGTTGSDSATVREDGRMVTQRVLRTREMAQQTRQRQKDLMRSLEDENEELRARAEDLREKNARIRAALAAVTSRILGPDREIWEQKFRLLITQCATGRSRIGIDRP